MHRFLLRTVAPGALAITSLCATAQSPYQVVDHWKIGGTGGWDYLIADPPKHRLYVTHNTRVEVIDTTTGKVVGAITDLKGTHGVALDPAGNFGYISDGGSNEVVIFDRKTLATVAKVPTGVNPDGIAFEPATNTVWAFNGRSKSVTVINAQDRSVVATIELPGKPEFPQVGADGIVYVNIEDKNTIVRLSAADRKITATWPLPGCESPSGMAIDPGHARLFSVCDGKTMAVTDAVTGKQLALAPIGDGPDAAGYSKEHDLAFSSNGDGTLTIVNTHAGYTVLQTLPTTRGARTMAYDVGTDRIYFSSASYGPAPAATAAAPHPRPAVLPDSFTILVVARK